MVEIPAHRVVLRVPLTNADAPDPELPRPSLLIQTLERFLPSQRRSTVAVARGLHRRPTRHSLSLPFLSYGQPTFYDVQRAQVSAEGT